MIDSLPLFLKGSVCKGFGRGSKELGIPTANLDDNVVKTLPADVPCGIYYGWAQVDSSPVYQMVMSIGWNPFYKNEKRTVEAHILHVFESDFYGSTLKVIVEGYTRPEKDFSSKEELIAEILNDISIAKNKLKEEIYLEHQNHPFFSVSNDVVESKNTEQN